MSGKNRSISLNCSLTTPATMPTPTPNTPEILNAIINISSHHLEKITANEIQLKREKTNENDQDEGPIAGPSLISQQMHEDNNINKYHSQFIREGLKMKVKQKIKEETFQTSDASFGFNDINDGVSLNFILYVMCNVANMRLGIKSDRSPRINCPERNIWTKTLGDVSLIFSCTADDKI